MNLNVRHIQILTAVILCVILAEQGLWIYNLYQAQYRLLVQAKDEALQSAILREHTYRYEAMGGTIVSFPSAVRDTARFYTKTIQLKDTSFQVQYDRYDPYSDVKLSQFILKDHLPVNVAMLDSLYGEELARRGVSDARTYIEYIDLRSGKVLKSSKREDDSGVYTASELKPVDIFKTIGIKGYITILPSAIVQGMTLQLLQTSCLILICCAFMAVIIKTFFLHDRMERMRQESVDMMTHEFRRPISAAVAQVALIPYYQKKGDAGKVEQYAKQSLLELEKLGAYTDRIQKLSNDSRESIVLNLEPIGLQDFFNSLVNRYETVKEKDVKLHVSLRTKHDTIFADLLHFANILDNLVENAIKYSKDDGVRIEIRVSDEGKWLRISVGDNGSGIREKDLPHIFRRFYRSADKNVRNRRGVGLGLTYVKAIVDAHAGEITVRSTYGVGTEFILNFPIESDAKNGVTDRG